jgi:hypothetical protein
VSMTNYDRPVVTSGASKAMIDCLNRQSEKEGQWSNSISRNWKSSSSYIRVGRGSVQDKWNNRIGHISMCKWQTTTGWWVFLALCGHWLIARLF